MVGCQLYLHGSYVTAMDGMGANRHYLLALFACDIYHSHSATPRANVTAIATQKSISVDRKNPILVFNSSTYWPPIAATSPAGPGRCSAGALLAA